MATHSSILAWRYHGQKSLAGYSPWGHKESDVTNTYMMAQKNELCPPHHLKSGRHREMPQQT